VTSAVDRLARARRRLAAAATVGALAGAAGRGLTGLAIVWLVVRLLLPAHPGWQWAGAAILIASMAHGAVLAARAWRRTTTGEVALWIEQRMPALDYALVTLADPRVAIAPVVRERLMARAHAARWEPVVATAMRRSLARPLVTLALGIALVLVIQVAGSRIARVIAEREQSAASAPGEAGVGGATAFTLRYRVRVVPPAYSGLAAHDAGEAASVAALEGSRVEITGAGAAPAASVDSQRVVASATAGGWRVSLAMPARPAALRLARGRVARLVVLEPRADSAPLLVLRAPVRDTVLREGRGALPLRAALDDDLGLADGAFEYIVSSGEGESFTFRAGRVGAAQLAGARRGALAATLDLAPLALKPGDVVHLRAVARDLRPGRRAPSPVDTASARSATEAIAPPRPDDALGVSETRTLRLARAGEYDSVAVEGAPPPAVDTTATHRSEYSHRALPGDEQQRRPLPSPGQPILADAHEAHGGHEHGRRADGRHRCGAALPA
jgi:hypothetical protein